MVLYIVVTDSKLITISKMFSASLHLGRCRLGRTPNTRETASARHGSLSLFKSKPLRPWGRGPLTRTNRRIDCYDLVTSCNALDDFK